jgi:hypothetical protein
MNDFTSVVQDKTDDELLKMVYAFDEWSEEMLQAVETELAKRNLLPADVAEKRQERIVNEDIQLQHGKDGNGFGMVIGWICVLGLVGLFLGYHYAFSKTRSKYTGKLYFKYDAVTRKNGSYIFYASITVFVLAMFYKIATLY